MSLFQSLISELFDKPNQSVTPPAPRTDLGNSPNISPQTYGSNAAPYNPANPSPTVSNYSGIPRFTSPNLQGNVSGAPVATNGLILRNPQDYINIPQNIQNQPQNFYSPVQYSIPSRGSSVNLQQILQQV